MKRILTFFSVLGFIYNAHLEAQNYKFGKVSHEELTEKQCPVDTTADACFLYIERQSHYEYQDGLGFVIVENYHFRVKIYNKDGFKWATHKIRLYFEKNRKRENVYGVKAYTYNLKNGKIFKTKLDKHNIYKEKTDDNHYTVKFTMPDVHPGSVLEWEYTFSSPFTFDLNPMVIQQDIPVKKLKMQISIPEYFGYRPIVRGYLPVNLAQDTQMGNDISGIDYEVKIYSLEMSNIPPLKKEPYTGNINNYRSTIKFELIYIDLPNQPRKMVADTWENLAKTIYKEYEIGSQLSKKSYIKQDGKTLAALDPDHKIKAAYDFIKKKIKWNGKDGYWKDNGVTKAYFTGTGNAADINLNLINLLKAEGVEAYPVLLSTVDHGIPLFPSRSGLNYLIAAAKDGQGYVLLDATCENCTPGLLPERDLNFQGYLIKPDQTVEVINLYPKTHSTGVVTAQMQLTEDETLKGFATYKADTYNALEIRDELRHKRKEEVEKWLEERFENYDIERWKTVNLDDPYKLFMLSLQFEDENAVENINDDLYVSPLMDWVWESNPFQSEKREYPVLFFYPRIEKIVVNLNIPGNYKVKKLPAPVTFSMDPQNSLIYQYNIKQNGNRITVEAQFVVNAIVVGHKDYPALKKFFDRMIAKQHEKIVLEPE